MTIVKAPARIDTRRLILRQPQMADAEAIFARYASDPEVSRFVGWPRHRSVYDTEAFLRSSAEEWERWPAGPYLIASRENGDLLGGTGLGFRTPDAAETGYVLARDAWGRGFATEALAVMVDLAPRVGITHLSALCHPQHRPSRRVLEKCGFVCDETVRPQVEFPNLSPGVQQDAVCYVLVVAP